MNIASFVIASLAIVANILPFLAGYRTTPPGMTFLGAVHHPSDYFYYLSRYAQGSHSLLLSRDLFTSEVIPSSFIGWFNVATGRIFSVFGLNAQIAYGTSAIVLTILVFAALWKLSLTLSRNRYAAACTVILFSVFHSFPMLRDGAPSYQDYWNNIAIPNVRLGSVPHQLFTVILSFVAVRTLLSGKPGKRTIAILTFSGIALASLQPILWGMIIVAFASSVLIHARLHGKNLRTALPMILPVAWFVAGGSIPAMYLMVLFRTEPFSTLRAWEALQRNNLTFEHFFLASGPVFLLALVSLPAAVYIRTMPALFTVFYMLFSLLLFLSPAAGLLHLTEVRFMSALFIVCVSAVAAHGLVAADRKFRTKIISSATILALLLYLVPNHLRTLARTTRFAPDNAYHYLKTGEYMFLTEASSMAGPDGVFLIIWPYNTIFPGITGRRSYHGHPLLTIDATRKDALADRFFTGLMPEAEAKAFLTNAHITHVIGYQWMPNLSQSPLLELERRMDTLAVYRVK